MILVGDVKVLYAGSIGACVVEPEGRCGRNRQPGIEVLVHYAIGMGFALTLA